jgi:hypothetical protein
VGEKFIHLGFNIVVFCGSMIVSQNPYLLLPDWGLCTSMLVSVSDAC